MSSLCARLEIVDRKNRTVGPESVAAQHDRVKILIPHSPQLQHVFPLPLSQV